MSTINELFPLRRAWPRQLIVYHSIKDLWYAETDESVLKRIKYLAVSYRQADWEQKELEKYIRTVCVLFLESNPPAYWLDFACIGQTQKELDYDLYRMADVFKYADETLIVIQDIEDGWRRWGERVWTFPEALLSGRLNYVVPGKNLERHIDLTRIANLAYSRRLWPDEWELLDAYRDHSKDPLTIADRLILGWKAIWNRSIGLVTDSNIRGYKADKVYALMGLVKNRIEPNHEESEAEALARLLEKNHLCGDIMDGVVVKTVLTPAYNINTSGRVDHLNEAAREWEDTYEEHSYVSPRDRHYSRGPTSPQQEFPYQSNLPVLRNESRVYEQPIIPETASQPRVVADVSAFTEVLRNSNIDHHGSLGRPSVLLHMLNSGNQNDSRIKVDADISDRFLRTIRLDSTGTDNPRPFRRIRSSSSAPESRRGVEYNPVDHFTAQPTIMIQPQPSPPRPIMTPVTSTRSSTPVTPSMLELRASRHAEPEAPPVIIQPVNRPPLPRSPPIIIQPSMARTPPPVTIIPPRAPGRHPSPERPTIIIQPPMSRTPPPVSIIPPRAPPLSEAPPIIIQPPMARTPSPVTIIPPTHVRRPLSEAPHIIIQPPMARTPPPVTIIQPHGNISQPTVNHSHIRVGTSPSRSTTSTQYPAPIVVNGGTRLTHRHRPRSRPTYHRHSRSPSPSLSSSSSHSEVRERNGRSISRSPSPIMPVVKVHTKRTHSRSRSSYEVKVSIGFDSHRYQTRRATQHHSSQYQAPRVIPTIRPPTIVSRHESTSRRSTRINSPASTSPTTSRHTPEVVVNRTRLVLKDSGRFDVAKATSPRRLMVRVGKPHPWLLCENQDILEEAEYLACSYSPLDFPDQVQLEEEVRTVCDLRKINAYWIDFACVGSTVEERNRDLYRMSDIFRGASFTVVMINGGEGELEGSWQVWRDYLWSLPAVLLSPKIMIYEVGDELRRSNLEDIRNTAYLDSDAGLRLIDAFLSRGSYSVYERVNLLQNALWSYSKSYSTQNHIFSEYLAERVYTLMGFMQYRISPDPQEEEHAAWDRLMAANGLQITNATSFYTGEQLLEESLYRLRTK